jgi:hypothetical protein
MQGERGDGVRGAKERSVVVIFVSEQAKLQRAHLSPYLSPLAASLQASCIGRWRSLTLTTPPFHLACRVPNADTTSAAANPFPSRRLLFRQTSCPARSPVLWTWRPLSFLICRYRVLMLRDARRSVLNIATPYPLAAALPRRLSFFSLHHAILRRLQFSYLVAAVALASTPLLPEPWVADRGLEAHVPNHSVVPETGAQATSAAPSMPERDKGSINTRQPIPAIGLCFLVTQGKWARWFGTRFIS